MLEKEAKEFLEAIHESVGYRPPAPDPAPPAAAPHNGAVTEGRDTRGKTTASSTQTTDAPTVGALAEGTASLPALGSRTNGARESSFSRVRDYRARHRQR